MSVDYKSIAVHSEAFKRLETIAVNEYRTYEGQIMAMCDLWEKTHGAKLVDSTPAKQKQLKLAVVQPIKGPGRGKYIKTKQHRENLSRSLKGRVLSEETKRKISQAARLNHAKKRLAQLKREVALS